MNVAPKNIIRERSFAFAIKIVELSKHLMNDQKEFVLSKQLLKSGTSIGANVREADNAESKPDFIHKMGIAQKEADETVYWIELLYATKFLDRNRFEQLIDEANQLLKIIKAIILSSKANR